MSEVTLYSCPWLDPSFVSGGERMIKRGRQRRQGRHLSANVSGTCWVLLQGRQAHSLANQDRGLSRVAPATLAGAAARRAPCQFRGGLVFKAHRLLFHSNLGLRVIKKKKKERPLPEAPRVTHTIQGYLAHKKTPTPL